MFFDFEFSNFALLVSVMKWMPKLIYLFLLWMFLQNTQAIMPLFPWVAQPTIWPEDRRCPFGGPVILLLYASSTRKDHILIHKWPQELIHCRTERYNMGKKTFTIVKKFVSSLRRQILKLFLLLVSHIDTNIYSHKNLSNLLPHKNNLISLSQENFFENCFWRSAQITKSNIILSKVKNYKNDEDAHHAVIPENPHSLCYSSLVKEFICPQYKRNYSDVIIYNYLLFKN